jgi:creatinine amidohydrolase/Fe(II)-dependent formamide hydrolase-like protein
MRIEELNWMDVEKYLLQDDRLMLVVGATEQHGYLSLATDNNIPLAMADAASQKTGILVAPPLNFGVSPYFTTYPGTILSPCDRGYDTLGIWLWLPAHPGGEWSRWKRPGILAPG